MVSHTCAGSNYLPALLPVANNNTDYGCKRNKIEIRQIDQMEIKKDKDLEMTNKYYKISAFNYLKGTTTLMALLTFNHDVSLQDITLDGLSKQVHIKYFVVLIIKKHTVNNITPLKDTGNTTVFLIFLTININVTNINIANLNTKMSLKVVFHSLYLPNFKSKFSLPLK